MTETKEAPKAGAKTKAPSAPEGWEIAHEAEGYVVLSKLVDTPLGAPQRISESGADLAEATENAKAYDEAHDAAFAGYDGKDPDHLGDSPPQEV